METFFSRTKGPILLLTILVLSLGLSAQVSEKQVVLETESGNIHGTLLLPSQVEKPNVVLIIAGSGPTDRNGNFPMGVNNSLKLLAEGLQRNGIASLRYDKRGIGESITAAKAEIDLRFEHYVEDAVAWIRLLKKDPSLGKVSVLGHSEGSLIGMIAAKEEQVANFISLAGSGVPAGALIREQLKEQPPSVMEQAGPILNELEKGKTVKDIPQMLFPLFRPSVQPYMISWFQYDPQEEIAKLDCPILIVQGTTDIQVSVEDAEKLHVGNTMSKKAIVDGMNHILKSASENRMQNLMTYSNPDLPIADGLMAILVDFLRQ